MEHSLGHVQHWGTERTDCGKETRRVPYVRRRKGRMEAERERRGNGEDGMEQEGKVRDGRERDGTHKTLTRHF